MSNLRALLPRSPALRMHLRRVAAVGQTLAHHLFLPTEDKALLHDASLLHHYPVAILTGSAEERLLADLVSELPHEVREVLLALALPGTGAESVRRLAEIIRMTDAYDQEYELMPFHARSTHELFDSLRGGLDGVLWSLETLEALDAIARVEALPGAERWKIPAFASAVAHMLALLNDANASLEQMAEAAGRDPATAARIVQLANSPLFPFRTGAATLKQAIARLGIETTRKAVASLMLRPLLVTGPLKSLWKHSLEVADLAEQIAERVEGVDRGEAYLCGLLHDIGRLVVGSLMLYDSARLMGLEQGGCPVVYAETLLLHTDHAAMGADLAEHWHLPPPIPDAIRGHHRPERSSSLAAQVLYLAEFLAGEDEDIPSQHRLKTALSATALTREQLEDHEPSPISAWLAAA